MRSRYRVVDHIGRVLVMNSYLALRVLSHKTYIYQFKPTMCQYGWLDVHGSLLTGVLFVTNRYTCSNILYIRLILHSIHHHWHPGVLIELRLFQKMSNYPWWSLQKFEPCCVCSTIIFIIWPFSTDSKMCFCCFFQSKRLNICTPCKLL